MREGQPSTITEQRIRLLEEAGFIWDVHGTTWEQKVLELREYRDKFSNCDVPCSFPENPQLAIWVKCQRRQYKLFIEGSPSSMTAERIRELEGVGFRWGLREYKKRGPKKAV